MPPLTAAVALPLLSAQYECSVVMLILRTSGSVIATEAVTLQPAVSCNFKFSKCRRQH